MIDTAPYLAARMRKSLWVEEQLRRFTLPSYKAILDTLKSWRASLYRTRDLWRQIFGDEPPKDTLGPMLDLDFLQRIDRECFPLDMWVYEEYLGYAHEDGLAHESFINMPGIVFRTLAVAWESEYIHDLDDCLQPMVACLAPFYYEEYIEAGDDAEALAAWWAQRGYAEVPHPAWARHYDWERYVVERQAVVHALESLVPPLDGLAALFLVCAKTENNPFFYTVPYHWQTDYGQDGFWDWDVTTVDALTDAWVEAQEYASRLRLYQQWYNHEGNRTAEERVIEVLLGLDQALGLEGE